VRKVAAQHELGHALGLAHNTTYRGIMGPVAWGYDSINTYERKELARIYGF
jgi:predicted Zn-dependent protease